MKISKYWLNQEIIGIKEQIQTCRTIIRVNKGAIVRLQKQLKKKKLLISGPSNYRSHGSRYRKKQKRFVSPPSLMERTRATVCLLQSRNREDEKMYAFLSLFHPEMSDARKCEIARNQ